MSQTTPYACPDCQKMLAIPNQHLGKQIRCPGCKNTFRTAAIATPTPTVPAAPVLTDDDPFGNDPFGNNSSDPFNTEPFEQDLANDPFADPGLQQANPLASNSARPAYLAGGATNARRGNARPAKKSNNKRNATPEMTEAEQRAFGSGIFLLVVPIVATVLPLMGLQLRRLAKLGDAAPLAGIVLGLVGAGFIAYARRNQKDKILSPILAGVFSVVIGVVGFFLLTTLHSESDLAGDQEVQGAMDPVMGGPDQGFDQNFQGGMDPNFDPVNDPMAQQHDDAMARHQQMLEDARRQNEQAMQEARDRHEKMREQMRKDLQNGGGFQQNGGGFQQNGGGFPGGNGGGLPGGGIPGRNGGPGRGLPPGGKGLPGGGFPPGNPFGGNGFGPPPEA